MHLVFKVFSFRPFLSSHKFAKPRVSCKVDFREGRFLLMMKMVVSSAKSTVESGVRTEGRSLIKAEKRVGPSIEPCGTPEHGKPSEEHGKQSGEYPFPHYIILWFFLIS